MRGRQLPEAAESVNGRFSALRAECRERGFTVDHVTDYALGYVLGALDGDVGLAADALAMAPRAAWVEEFVGT